MALKEKDQKNLDEFLALLEANKMRAELRGSAATAKAVPEESKKYNDLDLNVWDAEEKGPGYKYGRQAVDSFLEKIGVKKFDHSRPFMATWCEVRWQFNYQGTKFDVMYTPAGNWLAPYR